jgi:hypothetical protein
MTALFVVGPPGVGKTTLIRRFVEPGSALISAPKWTIGARVCAAGHYTGAKFDGADTVPYNGVMTALAFWEERLQDRALTIFDGDRFSYAGVRAFFRERNVPQLCIHLDAPANVLVARRAARGSNQNETWIKGRASKASKFAADFLGNNVARFDASKSVDALYANVRDFLETHKV